MTGLADCYSLNLVIPTEKPLGFDEESRVITSQFMKPKVHTVDPHVIRYCSFLRMKGLTDCHFEIYITFPLRMTILTNCHSPNPVILTEKPLGFDEESTVYTSQSSSIYIPLFIFQLRSSTLLFFHKSIS